jgi:hypothetical protein
MSKYSSCLFFFLLPIFGLEIIKVLTDAGVNSALCCRPVATPLSLPRSLPTYCVQCEVGSSFLLPKQHHHFSGPEAGGSRDFQLPPPLVALPRARASILGQVT